jgi:hypothetical protein
MKIPSLFSTNRARPFHYTPIFSRDEEKPIVKKLEDQNKPENKFKFTRKAKNSGLFPAWAVNILVPAAILAAIVYFCLIIVG